MNLPDVIVSTENESALVVVDHMWTRSEAARYKIGLVVKPGRERSRYILNVIVDDLIFMGYEPKRFGVSSVEEMEILLGVVGIGDYLDTHGMPDFKEDGSVELDGRLLVHSGRLPDASHAPPEPSMDDLRAYVVRKIAMGAELGLQAVEFNEADSLRLGADLDAIHQVAKLDEGDLWRRAESGYQAKRKLIELHRVGRVPGLERPTLLQVQQALEAPRYAAARQHFVRALEFMDDDSGDYANAVKEAATAVESLARVVTGREKETLGQIVKHLKQGGLLRPPLHKVFDAVWGYRSNEAGSGHGGIRPPDVPENHAALVINSSVAAIHFLLTLDQPSSS